MARLSLATRKLMRKKKLNMMLFHWFNILHLVNWFFQLLFKIVEAHVRKRFLKAKYNDNFYRSRETMYQLVYGSDNIDASLSSALIDTAGNSTGECSNQRRKRKSRSSGSLSEVIKEAAIIIGMEIKESTNKLAQAICYDAAVAGKSMQINEELLKLPGISMFERHKATLKIAREHEITDVFFTIADDEKEEWVKELLRGDI